MSGRTRRHVRRLQAPFRGWHPVEHNAELAVHRAMLAAEDRIGSEDFAEWLGKLKEARHNADAKIRHLHAEKRPTSDDAGRRSQFSLVGVPSVYRQTPTFAADRE